VCVDGLSNKEHLLSGTCGLYERVEKCVQERDHVEDLGIDGRTILKSKFHVYFRRAWIALSWVRISDGML